MAPTVCFIDNSIAGSDATSNSQTRHRPGRDGIVCKRQRLTSKQFPKIAEGIRTVPISILSTDTIREADIPSHPMFPKANLPSEQAVEDAALNHRRKELVAIIARTLALAQRNYMLQIQLDTLRGETKHFFKPVLNSPKNKNFDKNYGDAIDNDNQKTNSIPSDDKVNDKQINCIPFSNATP